MPGLCLDGEQDCGVEGVYSRETVFVHPIAPLAYGLEGPPEEPEEEPRDEEEGAEEGELQPPPQVHQFLEEVAQQRPQVELSAAPTCVHGC